MPAIDPIHAARCARFKEWSSLSLDMLAFIRDNAVALAQHMPADAAATLFERLELPLPAGLVTAADPARFDTWRERALLQRDIEAGKAT